MASIQTGIQLQDNFSNVIMGIINSVNLAVSAMDDMNQAMSTGMDTASIAAARNEINQATIAAQQLNQAFENMTPSAPAVPEPEPVPQTIEWQSNGLEVFNNTGIERYQQEIQSVNAMLSTLNEHQIAIDDTASNLDILPDNAIQDITGIHDRIQEIILRIQEIENNPINMETDRTNNQLERLRSQLNQALSEQENLNQAMNDMDVSAANAAYMRLSQTISSTERYIRDNISEQENFNRTVEDCHPQVSRVTGEFAGWQKAIIVANNAIGLIKNTLGNLGVMDMSGAFDRIDTMNRFQKTVSIMTGDSNKANAALEALKDTTLGTAYGLDVASKATQGFLTRGMSIGAATNQVRIWADAVSFYGEGTNEQLSSVVDAIGKMYSKGTVEADQLDRLFDAGIGAAEIYAKAVGQSVSEVKENLSEGEISAAQFIQTVSDALDKGVSAGAAKDAGATWATTFANMQAAITRGWTNVITNLDNELAARGLPSTMEMVTAFGQNVESVLNTVGNSMGFVVDCVMNVYNVMSSAGGFIADNWSVIEPIIWGVVAAMGFYETALIVNNVLQGISNIQKTIAAVKEYAHAKAVLANASAHNTETVATARATVAQASFNTALFACPLTWIILAIIEFIVIVYALVAAINKLTGTTNSAAGIICGVFAMAGAAILNTILGVVNFVIGVGVELYNLIASFANFFANVFDHPVEAIIQLFADMFDFIAGIVQSAAKLIDTVLGSDISGAVEGFRNDFSNAVATIVGDQTIVAEKLNASDYQFNNRIDYLDAFGAGYDFGEKIDNKIGGLKDIFKKAKKQEDTHNNADKYNDILGSTAVNTGDTAKNTAKVADAVTATSEDLKYLRELAETDYINRFTTAQITVNQTNNNNINNEMDLDGVTEHLRSTMEEQMFAAAEGVH